VDVPNNIETKVNMNGEIDLLKDKQIIGGIQSLGYGINELNVLFSLAGNHANITSHIELDGYFTEAVEVTLDRDIGTANSRSKQNEKHIFFITRSTNINASEVYNAYDIYLVSPYISDKILLDMAKSFKLISNSTNNVSAISNVASKVPMCAKYKEGRDLYRY
jgi:hypothetical protein